MEGGLDGQAKGGRPTTILLSEINRASQTLPCCGKESRAVADMSIAAAAPKELQWGRRFAENDSSRPPVAGEPSLHGLPTDCRCVPQTGCPRLSSGMKGRAVGHGLPDCRCVLEDNDMYEESDGWNER